jgi:cysteine synthase/molybdopterin converting factor small subunit
VSTVRMPPILRQAVGGAREVDASGATVREVLADLSDRFPGVRSHLLDDSGDLNRFVNVYVNNEDVRLGDGMDTAVSTDSTLIVLPAMAGGAPCLQIARSAALSAVGDTPLVELPRMSPNPDVRIFAKLEEQNPTGSMKDRVALQMIEVAEDTGELEPGRRILEPTSGNTGIALAMIGKVKGYPVTAVMPESATPERVELLRMYGAEIVFSPGNLGSNGAVAMARSMAERDPSVFMPFQYANPANPAAHYCGTALEILDQVPGGEVDAFVAGLGTGGTLMGCGRRLREVNPDVQIIAAEPLQGDPVMGLRSLEDGYTPPILDITQLDRKVLVSNSEAVRTLRELLNEEGVFAGISAGAALAVARKTAARMDGGNVVVVFADGGSKYLSAGIYTKPEDELELEMEERVWW